MEWWEYNRLVMIDTHNKAIIGETDKLAIHSDPMELPTMSELLLHSSAEWTVGDVLEIWSNEQLTMMAITELNNLDINQGIRVNNEGIILCGCADRELSLILTTTTLFNL